MKYFSCLILLLLPGYFLKAQQAAPGDTLKKKSAIALDSIIVFNTGYQAVSKYRSTGSFTQVDNKTLNLQVGSNIINRLESVTPAVAFNKKNNTAPALTVRGLSTINGPTAPLIILDNFPYEGDINSINPNMIESITILKDATAASIWGTRAGNGVIVINTKKGKYSQPLTIDFSSTVQTMQKPDIYYSKPIATSDYIDMEIFLFGKGYYNSQLTDFYHPPVSPIVELLDRQSRGLVSAADVATQVAAFRKVDVRDDFNNGIYQNNFNQQYALTLSGGDNRANWFLNGGYDNNVGELAQKNQRYTLRFENNCRLSKNLKINTSLYFVSAKNNSGKDGYTAQNILYPYSTLWDANGNPVAAANIYRMGFLDTLGGGRLLDWHYYPAEDYKHNTATTLTQNLIASLGLQYNLGKGFSIDLKYQYESQRGKIKQLYDAESFEARTNINLFSQINPATGQVTYIVPKGGILDLTNSALNVSNYREQLNYNRSWKHHQLTAMLGNEIREVSPSSQSYRTYGYDPSTLLGIPVDARNIYPVITTGEMYSITSGENTFEQQLRRFVSFYGNAAYTYKNNYTLNASARRDASNLFGVSTNNKWTPLWSVGAGWNISGEHFYTFKLLPLLKLRATYGYTGNADPKRSGVVILTGSSTSTTTGFPSNRVKQFPNPDLRWEQVAITNIGIDFASAGQRISGSLEWYVKKGIDLFGSAPVDITVGVASQSLTKNVANMRGTGIDLVLNTANVKGKILWNTNFIFSANKDKVTRAYLFTTSADRFVSEGGSLTAMEGFPVHSVISYRSAGLDPNTGDPRGYINGVISKDYLLLTGTGTSISDLQYSGPGLPQYFGSITNSLQWKNIQLDINVSYKFHYFFKRKPLQYSNLSIDRKSTADFSNRWQQPGDELITDVPSFIYPGNAYREVFYAFSSSLVEKGDHIRLQFINLAYNFKLSKQKNRVDRCQLFINAANLGILWRANKRGIDPDYNVTDIPPSKAFAFGFKINLQ